MADVFTALVHWPVYNKKREVIASALTTVDMHDFARLSATYGLAGFYVVTPVEDQHKIASEMIGHWQKGWGADYNPNRAEAMGLVGLTNDLEETKTAIAELAGVEPILVGTSANYGRDRTSFEDARKRLDESRPLLIIFGTAWGLTEKALGQCDIILEPISGPTKYNHLSVRSAASIVMDRLLGRR